MKREFKQIQKAPILKDSVANSQNETKEIEIKSPDNPETKKRNLRESINDIIEQDNQAESQVKRLKVENDATNQNRIEIKQLSFANSNNMTNHFLSKLVLFVVC